MGYIRLCGPYSIGIPEGVKKGGYENRGKKMKDKEL